jgi:hypothetical protein
MRVQVKFSGINHASGKLPACPRRIPFRSIAGAQPEVNMPVRLMPLGMLLPALLAASVPAGIEPVGVAPPEAPLPSAQAAADDACVDPGKVRSWSSLGDRRVLIDAGQQRYLIELSASCPQLSENPFLGYGSDHVAGRVCGRPGDRLVPHGSSASGGDDCPVRRMRSLSEDEYGLYLQRSAEAVATRPGS